MHASCGAINVEKMVSLFSNTFLKINQWADVYISLLSLILHLVGEL